MKTSHSKNWKIGALGASLVVASTSGAYAGVNVLTTDAAAQTGTASATATSTATVTATPSATPSFLQADCPVGGRSGLEGTETVTPESELASMPAAEATQSTEVVESTTYYDGQYSGDAVLAHGWGTVQVVAVIQGGELVDIIIAKYPHAHSQSNSIAHRALPTLICEAIEAQDAAVDFVSRATDTSRAFVQSLQSALLDAAAGLDL